jgi:hypothetical protein
VALWRSRRFWLCAAAVVVAIGVTWWLWPAEKPRARQYRDATACLLTGTNGVNGAQAKPVWAAMRRASDTSLVKVQYLEVDGPQTVQNAASYLASLAQSRCDVIVAVGDAPVGVLRRDASRFPGIRFVAVGPGAKDAGESIDAPSNVEFLASQDEAPGVVAERVAALAR